MNQIRGKEIKQCLSLKESGGNSERAWDNIDITLYICGTHSLMVGRHDMLNCNWMTQDGLWPKTIFLLLKTYSQLLEKRWWKSIFGANLAGPSLLGYKLHKCTQAVSFKGSVIGSGWCQNFQTSLILSHKPDWTSKLCKWHNHSKVEGVFSVCVCMVEMFESNGELRIQSGLR